MRDQNPTLDLNYVNELIKLNKKSFWLFIFYMMQKKLKYV